MIFCPGQFEKNVAVIGSVEVELEHVGQILGEGVAVKTKLEPADFKTSLRVVGGTAVLAVLAIAGGFSKLELQPRMKKKSAVVAADQQAAVAIANIQTLRTGKLAVGVGVGLHLSRGSGLGVGGSFLFVLLKLLDLVLQ